MKFKYKKVMNKENFVTEKMSATHLNSVLIRDESQMLKRDESQVFTKRKCDSDPSAELELKRIKKASLDLDEVEMKNSNEFLDSISAYNETLHTVMTSKYGMYSKELLTLVNRVTKGIYETARNS